MKINNRKLNLTSALAVVAGLILLSAVTPVKAQVVAVNVEFNDQSNYYDYSPDTLNGVIWSTPIAPLDYTGSVWNVVGGFSTSNLLYSDGSGSSGVSESMTYAVGNGTSPLTLLQQAAFEPSFTSATTTMTIGGLTAAGGTTYNLYLASGYQGNSTGTIFTINGVDKTASDSQDTSWVNNQTYVEYTGLTAIGGVITVTMNPTGGGFDIANIAGFQLQAVPEPSSMALIGIGALATVFVGRRLKFRNE